MEAARLLVQTVGVNESAFYASMESFTGAERRMQILPPLQTQTVINDFAHSPSKVAATVQSVVRHHAPARVVGLLELHTFSSFQPDFLPNYRGTTTGLSKLILLVDEKVMAAKGTLELDVRSLLEVFGGTETNLVSNKAQLEQALRADSPSADDVLLIMSSGALAGFKPEEIQARWVGKQ